MKTNICTVCGKEFHSPKTKKYCSTACSMKVKNKKLKDKNYQTNRSREIKKNLVLLKGGSCSICGYDKNLSALAFHHTDPSLKEMGLSIREIIGYSLQTLEKEVEKCIIVCHNCHSEIHNPQHNNWK